MHRILFPALLFSFWMSGLLLAQPRLMRGADVRELAATPPAARIFYGPDSVQFGELRLPEGKGPYPVIVILHGGCWVAAIADLHIMDPLASALTGAGAATWNLEYRRLGDAGGGWPNTFLDVAAGVDFLQQIASDYELDLSHVVVLGHSAGGHLALWLAARHRLPEDSPLTRPHPLPLSGVVSLAGIVDPGSYLVREGQGCGSNVDELMGGLPEAVPEHYRQGSPLALLPLGIPQVLITGAEDRIVPLSHIAPYTGAARRAGDRIRSVPVQGAGHFEVIAPGSGAWPGVEKAVRRLLRKKVGRPSDTSPNQNE